MSMVAEQFEFLKDLACLINKCIEKGLVITGGELWRTPAQAWINALPSHSLIWARDSIGNLHTYDPPVGGVGVSKSKHLDRLAIDFNFFRDGQLIGSKSELQEIGDYWESLSPENRWGGNFTKPDLPHFERNV